MADSRFYQSHGARSIDDIAGENGAVVHRSGPCDQDPSTAVVSGVSALASAGPDDLTYFDNAKRVGEWETARPGACFVSEANLDVVLANGTTALVVNRPQAAFARAAATLVEPREIWDDDYLAQYPPRIDATAKIAPSVTIAGNCVIGGGVVIEPGVVIGPGVTIGDECVIGANSVISFADIAREVRIHSGVQIGGAGFGLAIDDQGPVDAPHFGAVRIAERVTIGCNTTVDRGRFDDTIVGDGTKVDNLVQIAHNVRIGRACVIAGCCGLAGSAVLGDGVMLGGAGGVADHVVVGDGARLAAGAAAMRDVPAGETWAGAPARPLNSFFREVAALSRMARRAEKKNKDRV